MDARELKVGVYYVVKGDTYLFPKGTIVRREVSFTDDKDTVRFIVGNKMGYLSPADVEEIPPVQPLAQIVDDFEIPPVQPLAQIVDDFEIPPSDAPEVPQGHPRKSSHYQLTLLQPLEIMQRTMTKEEFIGFLKGNIIKYSIRGGHKEGESPEKDLTKVNTYHRWLRLAEQGQMINPMID